MGVRDQLQPEDLYDADSWRTEPGSRGERALTPQGSLPMGADAGKAGELRRYLDDTERRVLDQALRSDGNDLAEAAARLGLNLLQLQYRMQRLGIHTEAADR